VRRPTSCRKFYILAIDAILASAAIPGIFPPVRIDNGRSWTAQSQLIRDLERLGDEIYVSIVPTLCPLDVSPYDFSASHYLIERAAANTRKWLDHGGLSRRSSPRELQAHHHSSA
jgi:hypothetical protein